MCILDEVTWDTDPGDGSGEVEGVIGVTTSDPDFLPTDNLDLTTDDIGDPDLVTPSTGVTPGTEVTTTGDVTQTPASNTGPTIKLCRGDIC